MKTYFGDEYPAAVTIDGIRMPLTSERRWTRAYTSVDGKRGCEVSRFMDGSAAITFDDFAREWPTWDRQDRHDFYSGSSWLHQQTDLPDILRYIMQHGGPDDWSAIANSVGVCLPQDEAFDLLSRALNSTALEETCNISQGISLTKHPDAERVLRAHLAALWSHSALWDDDEFTNWLAYGTTCCIGHLIAVGAPPADFAEKVRALAAHPCAGNRDSCRRFLATHFPWLNNESNGAGNA